MILPTYITVQSETSSRLSYDPIVFGNTYYWDSCLIQGGFAWSLLTSRFEVKGNYPGLGNACIALRSHDLP